ncbi:hypothetical protein CsSME_00004006 [Camellia sinensis var. sinensis]
MRERERGSKGVGEKGDESLLLRKNVKHNDSAPTSPKRLPHLHAHSLAFNATLALQLNAHSTTKEQAQLREVALQEENDAYEKAISNCDNKIHEKLKEADLFRTKLQELDLTEKNLKDKLENVLAAFHA